MRPAAVADVPASGVGPSVSKMRSSREGCRELLLVLVTTGGLFSTAAAVAVCAAAANAGVH